MKKIVVLLASLLVLSGCATKMNITYNSDPQGAALYSNGQFMGTCPVTLEYNISFKDRRNGTVSFENIKVQWQSGAYVVKDNLEADIAYGKNQSFSITRPSNIAGRAKDESFALESQNSKLIERQQQQNQAQEEREAFWVEVLSSPELQGAAANSGYAIGRRVAK